MFGKFNNNGGNSNQVNVNTRIYTSYSDESLLILSAWNTNLSLKIQPAKGKNADGTTMYSSELTETITASISPETDQVLLAGIENEIVPAIKNKEAASIGVITGVADKRKIINITTDGSKIVLSVIFGGTINLDGTSEGTSVIDHTFNTRSYVVNYKKDVGGSGVDIPSDFYAFIAKLKELKYIDGAIAHGISYNTAVKSAIALAKNSTQQPQNTYQAPIVNADDQSIEDFMPFN